MSTKHVEGHANLTLEVNLDQQAQQKIDALTQRIERLKSEASFASDEIDRLEAEVARLQDTAPVGILEAEIERLKQHTTMASEEFKSFLQTVNLFGESGFADWKLEAWFEEVKSGAITASEAITRVKTDYADLISVNSGEGSGAFDAKMLQGFVGMLDGISRALENVQQQLHAIKTEGVAVSGESGVGSGTGGVGNVAKVLEEMRAAVESMSEGARAAYQPIIQLLSAITEYGNLDERKLLGISQAFRNIADIGSGSYGTKAIENIVYLVTQLQSLTSSGSTIHFDATGFNELHISKASYANLAEYLPQIAAVDTSKLEALSKINLTNFNNIKVSKASIQSIAQLAESLSMLRDMPGLIDGINNSSSGGNGGSNGLVSNVNLIGRIATLSANAAKFQTNNPGIDISKLLSDIEGLKAVVGKAGEITRSELNAATEMYEGLNTKLKEYQDGVATTTLEIEKQGEVTRTQQINQREFINQLNPLLNTITQTEKLQQSLFGEYSFTRGPEALRKELADLEAEINKTSGNDQKRLLKLQLWYEGVKDRVAQYAEEVRKAQLTDPSSVKGININSLYSSLETATNRALKLDNNTQFLQQIEAARAEVAKLESQLTKFKESGEGDIGKMNAAFLSLKETVSSIGIEITRAGRTDTSAGDPISQAATQNLNFLRQVESAAKQAQSLLGNNTKLFGTSLGNQLQGLIGQYDSFINRIVNSPPTTKAAMDAMNAEFAILKEGVASVGLQMEQTGLKGNTMLTRFANGIKKFGGWTIVTRALTSVIRLGRELVSNVREIDTAMTQLRIVTQASSNDILKFGDSAAQTAKEIGASITDIVDSATVFARLGYSLDESSTLAKYTSMLQAVGDIEASDAQDAITAITKAYTDVDINNIESVMDKLVTVGNNFPISVSQIAEGMNNASSALAAAGNTFEQSVALLTAANTTVQDISKASTGLRTITARLRNTTTDLEALGEDMTEAKYEELVNALTKAGVALRDVNGEYRSTYDIIKDTAAVWDTMSSMEQAAMTTAVAGTRMQNVWASLVGQFKEASGAMDAMDNSAGALTTSYDSYIDSVEGRMAQLTATFQSFSREVLSTDAMKGVIQFITGIVETLSNFSNIAGGAPATIMALYLAFELLTSTGVISWFKNLSIVQFASILSTQGLTAALASLNSNGIVGLLTSLPKLIYYYVAQAGAALAGTKAVWSFNAALEAMNINPVILALSLVIGAIAGVVAIIKSNSFDSALDRVKESTRELDEVQGAIDGINNELQTTKQRISELERQGTLTLEEEDELIKLKETNLQLERQLQLKNDLKLAALNDVEDSANRAMNTGDMQRYIGAFDEYVKMRETYLKRLQDGEALSQSEIDTMNALPNLMQSVLDNMEEIKTAYDEIGYDKLSKEGQDYYKQIIAKEVEYYNAIGQRSKAAYMFFSSEPLAKQRAELSKAISEFNDVNELEESFGENFDRYFSKSDVQEFANIIGTDYANAYDVLSRSVKEYYASSMRAREESEGAAAAASAQYQADVESLKAQRELLKDLAAGYEAVAGGINSARSETENWDPETNKKIADGLKRIREEGEKWNALNNGNVDYNRRPLIRPEEMKKYYPEFDGDIATTYSAGYVIGDYAIEVTPILENGQVLTQEELDKYVDSLITSGGKDSILGSDSLKLVMNVQPESKGQDYWDEYQDKVAEIKNRHWELVQQLENEVGLAWEDIVQNVNNLPDALDQNAEKIREMQRLADSFNWEFKDLKTELDSMRSGFDAVLSALKEIQETGATSSDTISKLLAVDGKYLNLLVDESGQLDTTSEAYEKMVKAKMEDMLVTQMVNTFDTVLKMSEEEAAAYAAAEAYTAESNSIIGLIQARMQLALSEASAKDAANQTNTYANAILRTGQVYAPLLEMIDKYSLASENATKSTSKATDALEAQKKSLEDTKSALSDYKDELSDAQSAINDLVDLVSDYIKQQKNDEKEALEERKKNFDDFVEKEKEKLRLKKEAEEFDRQLREKQNSVAKNALSASILSLDDSAAGRKALKKANDDLASSRDDLYNTLADHEYDITVQALDELKVERDKYFDDEIQKVDDYLSDVRRIYEDACLMIENDTGDLYARLWEYTYQHTTQTRAEFDHLWTSAQEAIAKYGGTQVGVINILEYLQGEIYSTEQQIDTLEGSINDVGRAIDSMNEKVKNVANDGMQTFVSRMSDLREEYQRMLDTMREQIESQKWHYEYAGQDVWSTDPDMYTAASQILSYINKHLRRGMQEMPLGPILGGMRRYATGTYGAYGGPSIVNEQGHEIRILNKGDGILTAKMTKNLSNFAANPAGALMDAGKSLLSKITNSTLYQSMFGSKYPSIYGVSGRTDQPINFTNYINGDVNPSTLKALINAQEKITENAINGMMKRTLGLRNSSRVR